VFNGKRPPGPVEGMIGSSPTSPQGVNNTSLSCKISNLSPTDNRMFLRVSLFDKVFDALVDTGSAETYISERVAGLCKKNSSSFQAFTNSFARVADGQLAPVSGAFYVSMFIDNISASGAVKFLPGLTVDILLGLDWLAKLGVNIDVKQRCVNLDRDIASVSAAADLNEDQKQKLDEFLTRELALFRDVPGLTHLISHEIRIKPDVAPIKQRYYPMSPAMLKVLHEEVDKFLERGIIEPSNSPWNSPVVMVKKPSGAWRFALNLKKVNSVSIPDAYPIPYVSSILDKLRSAKFISSIDLRDAYFQIPLKPESRQYTAFTVPNKGLFQFCVAPFGHHSSGATFQRLLERVIGPDLDYCAFPYLDDIIIFSPTFEGHLEALRLVF
jgi:predicted aspartyl protease